MFCGFHLIEFYPSSVNYVDSTKKTIKFSNQPNKTYPHVLPPLTAGHGAAVGGHLWCRVQTNIVQNVKFYKL